MIDSTYCKQLRTLIYQTSVTGSWILTCFLNRLTLNQGATLVKGDVQSALNNLKNEIDSLIKALPK